MIDRERVEVMFCSRLLYLIVLGGMEHNRELLGLAGEVIEAPLKGIDLKRSRNLRKRCLKLEQKYIHPFVEKAHGTKIAFIAYYFLNKLVNEDYLVVEENSPFMVLADRVFGAITNSLTEGSEDYIKVSDSAQKQADKLLRGLQIDGYFNF